MSSVTVNWVPSTITAGNVATLVWNSVGTSGLTFTGTGVNVDTFPIGENLATRQGQLALTTGEQGFYFLLPGVYPAIWTARENVAGLNQISGYANITVLQRPEITTAGNITVSNVTPLFNQPIRISANFSPSIDGDTVSLLDNTAFAANGFLSNGNVTFTLTNLSVGTHNVQAFYGGNLINGYGANLTSNVTVTVNNAANALLVLNNVNNYIANGDINNTLVGLSTAANALYFNVPSTFGNSNVALYLPNYVGNVASNINFNSVGNAQVTNIIASGFYFPNNQPFTSSVYSNANVATYMPVYGGNISTANLYSTSAGTAANSITATVGNITGNIIARFGQIASMKMNASVNAAATGAITLDCGQFNVFSLTTSGAITSITLTNPPPTGVLTTIYIFLIIGTSSSVAWPASFLWPSGTPPTITTTAGKADWYSATTINGGTNWYATIIGQNF